MQLRGLWTASLWAGEVLSTKWLTSKVTTHFECPAEGVWVLQFYSVVYCVSCRLSLFLSTAITGPSLQLHAPKAFVNSENRFSVPCKGGKSTGHLEKWHLSDLLNSTSTSARIWSILSLQSLTSIPSINSRLCCKKLGRVLMRKQPHWLHSHEKLGCYISYLYKYKIQVTLFCLHYSTWLKIVTLKDTVKEGASSKQIHHKERSSAAQESTNNSWSYKGRAAKKECIYLFPVTMTRCLLFLHLRQLKISTKTVNVTVQRKGVWLWSQQWLDVPVASHKGLLPNWRGEN